MITGLFYTFWSNTFDQHKHMSQRPPSPGRCCCWLCL